MHLENNHRYHCPKDRNKHLIFRKDPSSIAQGFLFFSAGAATFAFASGAAGVLFGTAGFASVALAGAFVAVLAEEHEEFSLFPQVIVGLAEMKRGSDKSS